MKFPAIALDYDAPLHRMKILDIKVRESIIELRAKDIVVLIVTVRIVSIHGDPSHRLYKRPATTLGTTQGDIPMTLISDTYTKVQDQRIQQDVTHQIAWQPEIHSEDISVKVLDANVTLTGFVHGYLEKTAAERAAKSVYGVVSVANDIEVKPLSVRTDPEIARDVVEALKLHASVPDEKIKVAVSDGFVTLTGTLDWHYEMENAELVAHSVNGVRGIVNIIKIKPRASSQQVREKIEDALKRMVDLDARSMSVVTSDGTVSLYGNVHSWAERERAEIAAWQAPGVQHVSNHLVIHP